MAKKTSSRPTAPAGTIQRSINLLRTALDSLGAGLPLMEVERLAVAINRAMTAEARSFHTPEHIFTLVDPRDPLLTLAALFHDLVYFNIDHGFIPEIEAAIGSGIEKTGGDLRLNPVAADAAMLICRGVFGYAPDQVLSPLCGMNELLSALVMNRSLAAVVPPADLLAATACIEATIPFRRSSAEGRSPSTILRDRVERTAWDIGIAMDGTTMDGIVKRAVSFANRDVANFAEREVARFLDNTWKLLPESNPSLRTQGVYTIGSYRVAMQKMEGFLRTLDPATIFGQFKGVPSDTAYAGMRRRAERNVATAAAYLGVKLLAASILEALAAATGGDAPVALFMGDIGAKAKGSRLEDHLPRQPKAPALPVDPTLHDLLAYGRAGASSFDLQNSPLSLFVYLSLGAEGVADGLAAARRMFDGTLPARGFLGGLPPRLAAGIARACSRMACTRQEALLGLAAELGGGKRGASAGR
jgi:hypothetical protein